MGIPVRLYDGLLFCAILLGGCQQERATPAEAPSEPSSAKREDPPQHARESEPSEEPSVRQAWGLASLPTQVLDGTSVMDVDGLLEHAAPVPDKGIFASEFGGAEGHLELRREGQLLQIERTYQEPGAKPRQRKYGALELDAKGVVARSNAAVVVGVTDGVLLYESTSDKTQNGVGSRLWVLYAPVEGGTP